MSGQYGGSTAELIEAAQAVVVVLRDVEGLPAHLNFAEADALAWLCHTAGDDGSAQALMHEWAECDDEAKHEARLLLNRWGIGISTSPAGDVAWAIVGDVER